MIALILSLLITLQVLALITFDWRPRAGRRAESSGRSAPATLGAVTQRPLPGDPAALRLYYHFGHGLSGDANEETLERWQVDIRHGGDTHDEAGPAGSGASVGHMVFYRIRLTQGMNAYWAMEAESEELYELAEALLDPFTGYFTEDVDQQLAYAGTDLLVMDRVVLDRSWRGFGLGPMLAAEAIGRLGLGCRAVACTPGISEPAPEWQPDQEEWDRVTDRIRAAWQRAGFTAYHESTYLLGPGSPEADSARDALRTGFQDLCLRWRLERADTLEPGRETQPRHHDSSSPRMPG